MNTPRGKEFGVYSMSDVYNLRRASACPMRSWTEAMGMKKPMWYQFWLKPKWENHIKMAQAECKRILLEIEKESYVNREEEK